MVTPPEFGFVFALVLAVVHLTAGRITEHERVWGQPLVSLSGGTTIAYVFVFVLPELNEAVVRITESYDVPGSFLSLDTLVYLVVMIGFLSFYGVLVFVTTARRESSEASDVAFWTHVTSFAFYNALIGSLLFHQAEDASRTGLLHHRDGGFTSSSSTVGSGVITKRCTIDSADGYSLVAS